MYRYIDNVYQYIFLLSYYLSFPSLWSSLHVSLHSQSYHLHTSREIHPCITLEPSPNYSSPKFRSRNQSYMRAVSTLSQASCVSQVSQVRVTSARLHKAQGNPGSFYTHHSGENHNTYRGFKARFAIYIQCSCCVCLFLNCPIYQPLTSLNLSLKVE